MVVCQSPFASSALSVPNLLQPPLMTLNSVGGQLEYYLTFPQAMDQTSDPADADWHVNVNGVPTALDSGSWVDATHYSLLMSAAHTTDPADCSYVKGAIPLRTFGDLQVYESFGPVVKS